VQCHSQTVGDRRRFDEIAFHKMCNVTHKLLVIGEDLMRLPISQNVQCCSQPIGDREKCDETTFHKTCNVTHILVAIGKDVMRLSFTKCAI